MQSKYLPVVGKGYTGDFFEVNFSDDDLNTKPHLEITINTSAIFAFQLADEGLTGIGINQGDYLLFSTTQLLRASGQICLIRREEELIIREAHWTPDMTILRVPNDIFPPIEIPTENIRIVATLDNVLKPYDGLNILQI